MNEADMKIKSIFISKEPKMYWLIRISALTGITLPFISLFLPFQKIVHTYFDEETNDMMIYEGTDYRSGVGFSMLIMVNYLILGIIACAAFTGKKTANRIITLLMTVFFVILYYYISAFLLHDFGATNARHSYWLSGWYIMHAGNVIFTCSAFLFTFSKSTED